MKDGDDYLWDRSGDDPEIRELERLLAPYAHEAPLRARSKARTRWPIVAAATVAVALGIIVAIVVMRSPDTDSAPGFTFRRAGEFGTLRPGGWLETEQGQTAELAIADIGAVTLGEASRLRLTATAPGAHRLELARGRLSARVSAPPRVFIVDTPAASAVDLGCAYEVSVDVDGTTHLRVTQGAVALEGRGGDVWVPAGHEVSATPRDGPDIPRPIGALETTESPVALWNVLARAPPDARPALAARLDALVARPESITDAMLFGDESARALALWRDVIEADLAFPKP